MALTTKSKESSQLDFRVATANLPMTKVKSLPSVQPSKPPPSTSSKEDEAFLDDYGDEAEQP